MQWSGIQRLLLRRPATHFVYLHHVQDLAWFEKLLSDLSRDFEFIDHDEGVRRIRSGQNVRPAVTFSFDDAFASCEPAMKALERSGTRGLIYICPDLVGLDDDEVSRSSSVGKHATRLP